MILSITTPTSKKVLLNVDDISSVEYGGNAITIYMKNTTYYTMDSSIEGELDRVFNEIHNSLLINQNKKV